MKKLMTILISVVLIAVVFAIVLKDILLKTAVEQAVTTVTGFKTKLESLKYDFPSTIHIKGLEILNPAGFEEKVFTNIPEIYVSLVLSELLQGKRAHLPEVRLNIQEVHIEKNAEGISNLEMLSSVGGKKSEDEPPAKKEKPAEKKPPMPLLLERLELTIRNVSFEDRSGVIGAAPLPGKKLSTDLNIVSQVFTNITDPNTLVNLIVVKILNGVTFGNLLNLSPDNLVGENLSGVLSSGQEMIGQQAAALQEGIGGAAGDAKSIVAESDVTKKAGETISGTASSAKEQVSGLFGKIKSLAPETAVSEKGE